MDFHLTLANGKKLAIFLLTVLLLSKHAGAQYKYNFSTPWQEHCTDPDGYCDAAGSTWRFLTVSPGTDAIVTIDYVSPHASLEGIDNNFYYKEAFLPQIGVDAFSTGYIDFTITFVKAGTTTPVVQDSIPATAVDIDGLQGWPSYSLYEWDAIDEGGGNAYYMSGTPEISVTQTGTAVTGKNIAGVDYAGLDTTNKDIMFTVVNKNISSIKYEIGVVNNYSSYLVRTKGIYWRKFTFPSSTSIILPNYLTRFSGQKGNSGVRLQWSVSQNDLMKDFVIEYSSDGIHFIRLGSLLSDQLQGDAAYYYTSAGASDGFYRIRLDLRNGTYLHSQTLVLKDGSDASTLSIFPNPATTAITLKIKSPDNELARLVVFDAAGRMVMTQPLYLNAGSSSYAVDLSSIRLAGSFDAVVYFSNGSKATQVFQMLK